MTKHITKHKELFDQMLVLGSRPQGFRVSEFSDTYTQDVIAHLLRTMKKQGLLVSRRLPFGRVAHMYFTSKELCDQYFRVLPATQSKELSRNTLPESAPVVFAPDCKYTVCPSWMRPEDTWVPGPPRAPARSGAEDFLKIPSRGIG